MFIDPAQHYFNTHYYLHCNASKFVSLLSYLYYDIFPRRGPLLKLIVRGFKQNL